MADRLKRTKQVWNSQSSDGGKTVAFTAELSYRAKSSNKIDITATVVEGDGGVTVDPPHRVVGSEGSRVSIETTVKKSNANAKVAVSYKLGNAAPVTENV